MPRAMPRHLWCILLAAAVNAFPTNDAERVAFAYLINGTEPADGLLEVDAVVGRETAPARVPRVEAASTQHLVVGGRAAVHVA